MNLSRAYLILQYAYNLLMHKHVNVKDSFDVIYRPPGQHVQNYKGLIFISERVFWSSGTKYKIPSRTLLFPTH